MSKYSSCWVCNSELTSFYSLSNIPVNDVVLMPDFDAAQNVSTGDLELAYCKCCSFIQNTLFNKNLVKYDQDYEEPQSFSNTFKEYDNYIINTLQKLTTLENKTIIDIGCGKGDFLIGLCNNFDIQGIGIDPAYRKSNNETPANVSFYTEKIEAKLELLKQADILVCRHTLEHIPESLTFFDHIISNLDSNKEVVLLLDLPSSERIINTCAYWDIYYEHCGYFSKHSLNLFLEKLGCKNISISYEYNNQYLLATCIKSKGVTSQKSIQSNNIPEAAIQNFTLKLDSQRTHWQEIISKHASNKDSIILWGGGSKAVAFLSNLSKPNQINAIYDINPTKQGNYLPGTGHKVLTKHELTQMRPDVIIIMNGIYKKEIITMLNDMDLTIPLIYCLD